MTIKALQKQLFAAIAMVLVATVALGSSTYAWFASQSSVKADGVNISATTVESIYIVGGIQTDADKIDKSTISLNVDAQKLYPVKMGAVSQDTTLPVQVPAVYSADGRPTATTSGSVTSYQTAASFVGGASSVTYSQASTPVSVDGTELTTINTVATSSMSVVKRSEGTDKSYDYTASVKVTDIDVDVPNYKCLRCAYFVSTDDGATWKLAQSTTLGALASGTEKTFTDVKIAADVKANTPVLVQFIAFYDGDSEDCIANNFVDSDDLTLEVTFTAPDHTS